MNFDNIDNCEYEPTGINAQFGYNTPNMMNNNGCNCKARDELGEKIESKAEKPQIAALHQRLTTMFAVNIASMIGSIMILALLSYLIISIAR